jgi:hypothetical protein
MLTRSPEFNPTEGTEAAPPKAISFTRTQAIRTFLEKVTDLPVVGLQPQWAFSLSL